MAGVLVTWYDIRKAEYPSKFWAFSGMDVGPDGFGRDRREAHLVEREYVDKNGETKTRMSTTFDPWLQSRLLGVLGGSLMRKNSPYKVHYYNYRHRMETDPARKKGTLLDKKNLLKASNKAHAEGNEEESLRLRAEADHLWHPLRIHRASLRYMVKNFVADFWREWRIVEGLPVVPRYHEAKMGHVHHVRSSSENQNNQDPTEAPSSEAAE